MSLESIEKESRDKIRQAILDLYPDVQALLTVIARIMAGSGDVQYAIETIEEWGDEAFDKWNDGTNYEESLINADGRILEVLRKEVEELVVIGVAVAEAADYLSKRYYATRVHDISRVMVTERTRISAAQEVSKGNAYIYRCVGDEKTCQHCLNLDGTVFMASDARIGDNLPPIHPWCRCKIESINQTGGKHYPPYDPSDERDIQASEEYRKISRKNDVEKVAKASGMSVNEIRQIKSHIFYEKHNLVDGYRTLYPDYDMAVAWKRLAEGRPVPRDITLLRHELLESQLEKEYNYTISEAHRIANQTYNWEKELDSVLGEGGEPSGLL